MNIRIPGLSDAIEGLAGAFQAFADALRGYKIMRSALVPRGEMRRFEDGGKIIVAMHPLDAITAENVGDPLTELDEALAWITERAHAELDTLLSAAGNRAMLGAVRQRERMAAFCKDHGFPNLDVIRVDGIIDGSKIVGGPLYLDALRSGRHGA